MRAAPNDYIATTATFTFNATQNQDCVNVVIIPDSIVEGSKTFSGTLDTRTLRITLNPAATVITITDDDDGGGK